ncbi:MAG: FtsX-like permease family protein [Rhabdochlamydiaceae bacterium]|nr:FtsX-like permease family protein [Candidatus Amphrikana amoebophyrae]
MIEFSFARKYLIPTKKKLSVSLIAILSCAVISLVIWLLLLFLSVTEGMEKNWLKKMTTLNAPVRIVPTSKYFNTYYYLSDTISASSGYSSKTIYEKLLTDETDPYDSEFDEEIPRFWQKPLYDFEGNQLDLIKTAFSSIEKVTPIDTKSTDYQVTAGMLRLELLRPTLYSTEESYISQASYISSFNEASSDIKSLLVAPTVDDLNHLLYLSQLNNPKLNSPVSPKSFHRLLQNCTISELKTTHGRFVLPHELFHSCSNIQVWVSKNRDSHNILVPISASPVANNYTEATLFSKENKLYLKYEDDTVTPLDINSRLIPSDSFTMQASLIPSSLKTATSLSMLKFGAQFILQNQTFKTTLPFQHVTVSQATLQTEFDAPPKLQPLWPYTVDGTLILPTHFSGKEGVLVPKSFIKSGVKIGDSGSINYAAFTGSSSQEMRAPISVAGFYDPGPMALGARYILAPRSVVDPISAANSSQSLDPMMANGINVWLSDIKNTPEVAQQIALEFKNAGIDQYFSIIPYYDFEFAKDLIQQLKSDRYIFTLVGIIILGVACCNIVSLLLLLVNDKKKEIGILKAMGASTKSIVSIFALCGLFMGIISFAIGSIAAILTLKNIDTLVHFLSYIQGQSAFNTEIYGQNLPSEVSMRALYVMAIATPIVSLLAGLIPALRAAKISPTQILRNES